MSFFNLFNEAPIPKKPSYKVLSEVPTFKLMKVLNMQDTTTNVGPTVRVNCMDGDQEIFYYVNKADYKKFQEIPNFLAGVQQEIHAKRNPFIFLGKFISGLGVVILPFCKL